MTTDNLLSELDRQRKYLDQLPPDFSFPLFNARRAIESQRRSGYRDTAAASREIVDNAIEAGAKRIHVVFDTGRDGGPRQVNSIAFIDDGSGMLPTMARFALSWGGGTHFDDPKFIGKFGFGLPNASINQTRRTEVYTRTGPDEGFSKAWLNLDEFVEHGAQSVPPPVEAELPEFVARYLHRNKLALDHGTVVVWINPDRLTYKKQATLKEHLVDDFGVTYRYLLCGEPKTELIVEGVHVAPVDPLFLMPEGRYYVPADSGGAFLSDERFLTVRYYTDPETGESRLDWLRDADGLTEDDANLRAIGNINVRIARFPVGFAAERGDSPDVKRRLEIRKPRRGISFVRASREVQTVDVFPKSERDKASGMGSWPLLQTYAYHWGVEVRFQPELDDVFGITNDKQGVRPIEDFWRVLHEADVDTALRKENEEQRRLRERDVPKPTNSDQPTAAEQAAEAADAAEGRRAAVPEERLDAAQDNLRGEAQRRADVSHRTVDEALEALQREATRRPYRIDFFDSEDGPFYRPDWVGSQLVVMINQSHPFYRVLYADLLRLPGGQRAKEAVDVLLISLARAEMTSEDDMAVWYEAQRKGRWSPFLETAMKILAQRLPTSEESAPDMEPVLSPSVA